MKKLLTLIFLCISFFVKAQVGIGTTTPLAMLDITSTTGGLLIPRMTTFQRDAIVSPVNGLQIYNTTTNSVDIFRLTQWQSSTSTNPSSNLVYVHSLSDLPTPSGSVITLNASKMYVFSGIVNISTNYLNLNGAGLRGTDPAKDGVMSFVSGAVLRSTGVSVFIENLAVIPGTASTKAYDFTDATGTLYCNLFAGCSVVDAVTPSLGVGQISGFKAITIIQNFWNCKDGIKITGNVGKLCSAFDFITGITAGSGIEFLAGLTIQDVDLSNNYFTYTGQTGIKLNVGATIDLGRMNSNMFRGVTTPITGFDSYSPGWQMISNTGVPNTRTFGYVYMNSNATVTPTNTLNTFVKLAGTSTAITLQKTTSPVSNRITYVGKKSVNARILVVISGFSPNASGAISLAIAKNGTVITIPQASLSGLGNNQNFQLVFETEVILATNDYVEPFIANNAGTLSYIIKELQFRLIE